MNLRISSLAAAAIGACSLFVSSCVGPEGAYVGATAGGYGPSRSYSNYSVTMADGYAGRGYYYGPPNTRYYSRQPGVVYYRTRESVPSQYWGYGSSQSGRVHVSSTTTTTSRPSSYRPGYSGPSYRDGDRWDSDHRDDDRRSSDRREWDGRRDDDDDDDRRGSFRR